MDWKEALLARSREIGIDPADAPQETESAPEAPENNYLTSSHLNMVMERKGRGGNTATIIEGCDCTGAQLKEIAATLKQRLGTGGSPRGNEILIQGDRRDDLRAALKSLGFKHIKG